MKAHSYMCAAQKRRFLLSSAVSGAFDTAVFVILINASGIRRRVLRLVLAAVIARAISSILNYQLNSRYVFRQKSSAAAARYYVLCAVRLCFSCGVIGVFSDVMNCSAVPVKVLGDMVLGIGSYRTQSIAVFNPSEKHHRFFGPFARNVQTLLRLCSQQYKCDIHPDGQPVVYVCRHLNMHGPWTALKWLPFDTHPLMLSVFFDRKVGYEHMRQYTFSSRWGRKPLKFSAAAWVSSRFAYNTAVSLQGVPVYRKSANAISTLKTGLRYLRQGESLIVFPDVDYTGTYGEDSDIYAGFLYYGEMYFKSTGTPLRFVPLFIDDRNHTITDGTPITVSSRAEVDSASRQLKAAINGHAA